MTLLRGGKHPQNAAIEGYVFNSGILPLYRVEAVPSNFDAAKPDAPLFRAPLYRATYCKANDKRVILAQTTCSIHIADIAAGQLWITAKYKKRSWTTACGSNDNREISRDY